MRSGTVLERKRDISEQVSVVFVEQLCWQTRYLRTGQC